MEEMTRKQPDVDKITKTHKRKAAVESQSHSQIPVLGKGRHGSTRFPHKGPLSGARPRPSGPLAESHPSPPHCFAAAPGVMSPRCHSVDADDKSVCLWSAGKRSPTQTMYAAATQPPIETKNPRVNLLVTKWQHVWLLALDRRRKLNDALDRLEEVTTTQKRCSSVCVCAPRGSQNFSFPFFPLCS